MTQEKAESMITDEMRASIGVEGRPTTLEVDKAGIRMFARAVGQKDPVFYDEAYAKSKGHRSLVAPEGFFGTPIFNPSARKVNPTGSTASCGMVNGLTVTSPMVNAFPA